MGDNLRNVLIDQTDILFENIEDTIAEINESQLYDKNICNWELGYQIFHFLHSLDKWFINPAEYKEQEFISVDKNNYSKNELLEYFAFIKMKIFNYLKELNTDSLESSPAGCQFNKLTLILGQYRHLMYHIGYLHACLKINTGEAPKYIGLELSK
jgi:hypothetical protein